MGKDIVVIGGGASGMISAIVASRNGADVTLLERNDRLGKKLLATGNGRCNYTNINLSNDNYHGKNPKFTYSALGSFDVGMTIDFFERLGITPFTELDGRVFPMSLQSSSVLEVLKLELEYLGVDIELESFVKEIKKKSEFELILDGGRKLRASKVIMATGGTAMPVSGSDGNGYRLVKSFGHSITDYFPGLVQLKLEGDLHKGLQGVKFPGKAMLYSEGKLLAEDFGDVLFTDYGISGPPILQISRTALDYLNRKKDINLHISIIHDRSSEELTEYLNERFLYMGERTVEESLIGLINKKLIAVILNIAPIDPKKKVAEISKEEVAKLSKILTDWKFEVKGSKDWKYAQVTAGGVATNEVDNRTMESKKVEGLFITGELLDIDGDCGGYNLQWAWSSGYIAGITASSK